MPKTKTPTPQRIARLFERNLIDLLKNGRQAFNADGTPLVGDDGKPVYRPASAPDLKVCADWLRSAGVKPSAAMDPWEKAMNDIRAKRSKSAGLDAEAIAGRIAAGGGVS